VSSTANNEFEIGIFAERYELLSDTFIEMGRVTSSLDRLIPRKSTIFEIGLGTGYFASTMAAFGHTVEGIQPHDEMLPRLREKHPDIHIVAEKSLEDFAFRRKYSIIVAHSAVFLFTKHEAAFGGSNEVIESIIFQCFIADSFVVFENLFKVIAALEQSGHLYINVQLNPLPSVEVGPVDDPLKFEMLDCKYLINQNLVVKHFKSTYRGVSIVVKDERYCLPFIEFVHRLSVFGVTVARSNDGLWIILSRTN
jgi:hypothetical protein